MAVEPCFSEFIEKLKPDIERLRLSNDFGVKIYNRLVKQYPQLASEKGGARSTGFSSKRGGKEGPSGQGRGPQNNKGGKVKNL